MSCDVLIVTGNWKTGSVSDVASTSLTCRLEAVQIPTMAWKGPLIWTTPRLTLKMILTMSSSRLWAKMGLTIITMTRHLEYLHSQQGMMTTKTTTAKKKTTTIWMDLLTTRRPKERIVTPIPNPP